MEPFSDVVLGQLTEASPPVAMSTVTSADAAKDAKSTAQLTAVLESPQLTVT